MFRSRSKISSIIAGVLLLATTALALEALISRQTGEVIVAKKNRYNWTPQEYDGTNCCSTNGLWVYIVINNASMKLHIRDELIAAGLDYKLADFQGDGIATYCFRDTNNVQHLAFDVSLLTNYMETEGEIPFDTNVLLRVE